MPSTVFMGVSSPWRSNGKRLRDGNVVALRLTGTDTRVAAASEERLSGRRYDPYIDRSVRRVFDRLEVEPDDELHVAVSSCLGPIFTPEEARAVVERATGLRPDSVRAVPHHDSHALEAFVPSPFDEALVLITDSAGNLLSCPDGTSVWENQSAYLARRRADGSCELRLLERYFPDGHGYGQLYRAVTRYVGFPVFQHASKVMALAGIGHDLEVKLPAPYRMSPDGTPRLPGQLGTLGPKFGLQSWLEEVGHQDGGHRDVSWYESGDYLANGRRSIRPTDLELAAWVQRGWQELLLTLASSLIERTGVRNICLGGGVALNCVANSLLLASPGVDAIHVGPAPGDHGQSLGNLLALLDELAPELSTEVRPPYFSAEDGLPDTPDRSNVERVVSALDAGQIVAVCRGTPEFGPRALGHRSLLCLPHERLCRRLRQVKTREDYQPFAATLTQAYAAQHLEGLRSPFMSFAPHLDGRASHDLEHVLHEDGTCRIQTLEPAFDPWFHQVLEGLEQLGRPPIAVNTSLNLRSRPMVDRVESPAYLAEAFQVDLAVVEGCGGRSE
jgi:carbamoyltransferase